MGSSNYVKNYIKLELSLGNASVLLLDLYQGTTFTCFLMDHSHFYCCFINIVACGEFFCSEYVRIGEPDRFASFVFNLKSSEIFGIKTQRAMSLCMYLIMKACL